MTRQEFWNAFDQFRPGLERLISSKSQDFAAYHALSASLHEYNEFLIPEITLDTQDGYVLIISCDGNNRGIPAVERLTKDLPGYSNWTIVKYRQPGPMEVIPLKGQNVKRKDLLLSWEKTSTDKYNLTFFLKWYLDTQVYRSGVILHMDHTIGEYDAMTRIEAVQFKRLGLFSSKDGLKTLDDLKVEIDGH